MMFDRARKRIRFLVSSIGIIIISIVFISIYAISSINIGVESKNKLEVAIKESIKNPHYSESNNSDLLIFKLEYNTVIHANDNYLKYDNKVLQELYKNCSKKENEYLKVDKYHFRYSILNIDGEDVFYVYDMTMVSHNLRILLVSSASFFILMIFGVVYVSELIANNMVNPLEITYIKQKQFIENASHELKTPLAIINANIDSMDKISKKNEKWVFNIKNQVERMNDLVRELLELFRVEAQDKNNIINVNLSDKLKKVVLSFEVLSYEKNVKFSEYIDNDVYIKAKESNIDKMINILLDNALKYSSENGYININLVKEKKKIVLIVENSGCDLDKEDIEKIFERFYKKNGEDSKSFGLGLAILKAIVDSLNGTIEVDCKKNEYTKFIINFNC